MFRGKEVFNELARSAQIATGAVLTLVKVA